MLCMIVGFNCGRHCGGHYHRRIDMTDFLLRLFARSPKLYLVILVAANVAGITALVLFWPGSFMQFLALFGLITVIIAPTTFYILWKRGGLMSSGLLTSVSVLASLGIAFGVFGPLFALAVAASTVVSVSVSVVGFGALHLATKH